MTVADTEPRVAAHIHIARGRITVLVVLVVFALVLPPNAAANALSGPSATPAHVASVVLGFWLLKAVLLLHALLLLVAPRWLRVQGSHGSRAAGLAPSGIVSEPAPMTRVELGALLLIVLFAIALRVPALGRGLWFDEIQTLVEYARSPMARILTTFDSQNQHMLYSILARCAFAIFGESAWALRLPAMCFGVASLIALVWFGARVTSRREALLAAALLAVSYHHVWFSQDARGYTGLMFFALVGSGCFLLLLAEPERNTELRVFGYGASMALANWVHMTAVFITIAHAIVFLLLLLTAIPRSQERARAALRAGAWRAPLGALVLAGTLSLLLYSLVLPQFFATALSTGDGGSADAWKDPRWMVTEGIRVLSAGIPGGLLTLAVALAVFAIGIASYWRRSRAVVGVMLLPAILTGSVVAILSHNLWPRFFFFSAGFLVLVAMRGGFAIVEQVLGVRGQAVATVGALAAAALSLMTVPRAWGPKQDFEGARAFVAAHAAPGDAVAGVDMTDYVYRRYYGLGWAQLRSAADLASVETSHARTWVVAAFPARLEKVHPLLWSRVQSTYRTIATLPGTVGGGTLYVMVSK